MINFISSKDDNGEEYEMHSKSDNIEIMMNYETDVSYRRTFWITQKKTKKNQNKLEESLEGSEFVFDYVYLYYYKCHKINLNRGGSYIYFPDWIKNKKATINPVSRKR